MVLQDQTRPGQIDNTILFSPFTANLYQENYARNKIMTLPGHVKPGQT